MRHLMVLLEKPWHNYTLS